MPVAVDLSLPAGTTVIYLGFEALKGPGLYNVLFQDPVRIRAGVLTETYSPGSAFMLAPDGIFSDPNASIGARDTKVAPLTCENGARFYVVKRRRQDNFNVSLYLVLEDTKKVSEHHNVGTIPGRIKGEIRKAFMENAELVQKFLSEE